MFFDAIVLGVFLLSVLIGFVKGLLKELFTLIAWAGGFLATYYLTPIVIKLIPEETGQKALYDFASGTVIFIVVMFVLSLIFSKLMNKAKKKNALFMDRPLGGLFGAIRAILLVCLAYVAMMSFFYKEKPIWVQNGQTDGLVEFASSYILDMLPEEKRDYFRDYYISIEKLATKKIKEAVEEVEEGYTEEERHEIDRILEDEVY